MQLVVINYNGNIIIGELKEWSETELILGGALSFEPTTKEEGGMRLSPFPLGNSFMLPDKSVETRLPKNLVPCYSLFDLKNEDHEVCQMYNSYWSV